MQTKAPAGSRGAESLLPCIDQVLHDADVNVADIEAFAVSVGPGSFTGLRVGVATIKGLAFDDTRPVAAVPTLAAIAFAAETDAANVVAVLDAQRGELYAAGFAREDGSEVFVSGEPEQGVYRPEELASRLAAGSVLAGQGAILCAEALGRTAPRVVGARLSLDVAVGRLGQLRITAGDVVSASDLVPRYVRRAEAEVQRTGERFE